MPQHQDKPVTRRAAIAAGLVGATLAALTTRGDGGSELAPETDDGPRKGAPRERLPVVYLPHGGGPWPFVEMGLPKEELAELADYLRSLHTLPKSAPKALLVVSAHWEEPAPTVMSAERPPLFYDYYGFPAESYRLEWPAPGHPELAARVRELLHAAGFESATDAQRGFDHGTFVPLKLTYPNADVPTIQLSLQRGLDPAKHLAIGRALAPLREQGVLIVGSGMSYHNMRGFGDPRARSAAETFDAWLRETASLDASARDQRLVHWASAPAARQAHPREEHLLPLMVVAGAAGDDRARLAYHGTFMGARLSAFHFG